MIEMTSQIQNVQSTRRGFVLVQNSSQRQLHNPATHKNIRVKSRCVNVTPRQQVLKVRAVGTPTAPRSQVPSVQCRSGPMKVMITGAPAAGKGTQCAEIIQKYGLVHISVGDLLRAEVKAGTPAGTKAKGFMDAGQLVPDEVVVEMVVNRLNQDDVKQNGWLLDGYPRSQSQAAAIEKEGIRPDVFLVVDVPDDLLIERVVGRRLDPETGDIYHLKFKPPPAEIASRLTQRSDDTEEKARTRLQVYKDNNASVVQYYTKEIVTVNGDKDIKEVSEDIFKILNAILD